MRRKKYPYYSIIEIDGVYMLERTSLSFGEKELKYYDFKSEVFWWDKNQSYYLTHCRTDYETCKAMYNKIAGEEKRSKVIETTKPKSKKQILFSILKTIADRI